MYNPVVVETGESEEFDPSSPRFQCCCGCHVADGIKILIVLGIIGTILECLGSFPVGLIFGIPVLVIYCSALNGIKKLRPNKLTPLIWLFIFNLVFTCALAIIVIVMMFDDTTIKNSPEMFIFIFGFLGCYIALQAWFLHLAYRCREYLKGMAALRENEATLSKQYLPPQNQQEKSEFIC